MKEIIDKIIHHSGIHRDLKDPITPEGFVLQGMACLLELQRGMNDQTSSVPDMFRDVWEFHKKFGLDIAFKNGLPEDLKKFRIKCMREEISEYTRAKSKEDRLDALIDLVYFALGSAALEVFDWNEAWRRVQEANMAKVRAMKPSDSKRGSNWDVVKPEGWQAPDLSGCV